MILSRLTTSIRSQRKHLAQSLLCCLLGLAATPGIAAPTVEFDFDDPPDTSQVLSDAAKWGMDLHANIESRHDLDLDSRLNDRLLFIEPEFRVALSYNPPGASYRRPRCVRRRGPRRHWRGVHEPWRA